MTQLTTELDAFLFLFPNKTAEEFEAWKNDPANASDYLQVQEVTKNANPIQSHSDDTPE